MNTKREVWNQAQQDQELAAIIRYLGEHGMLGTGASIRIEPDGGEAVEWVNRD